MTQIDYWLSENQERVYNAIDKVLHKVKKEYKKNRITHERFVEIIAWEEYLEIRTQEIPIFGGWTDREDTIEFDFDVYDEENQQILYDFMFEVSGYYSDQGFDSTLDYARPNSPRLTLTW